jgi:hypothetical protein
MKSTHIDSYPLSFIMRFEEKIDSSLYVIQARLALELLSVSSPLEKRYRYPQISHCAGKA